MATVLNFPCHRARPAARHPASTRTPKAAPTAPPASPPEPTPRQPLMALQANPRNRYDAAFKGHMARRAGELVRELRSALSGGWDYNPNRSDARIYRVIEEIEAIRDEVMASVEEHHPPAETK